MDTLISELSLHQQKATSQQLTQIARHVATAPFADDLLAVDEPLWGGFWHGDVIAPGYRLPAVELALLRATRLDGHWPENTTTAQFLADLRQAIRHPQAGVWTLAVVGEPCVVFAAESDQRSASSHQQLLTVVWYCALMGRLHAGYRVARERLYLAGATEQRGLGLAGPLKPAAKREPDWVAQVTAQRMDEEQPGLAARLDLEILRLRTG